MTATSTSPLPPPPDHHRASWCPAETVSLVVSDMSRSLKFYLDLGCEVRCAADGWVLLHSAQHPSADTTFVLTAATADPYWRTRSHSHRRPATPPPPIWLSTPDLRALRRRLRATGGPAATITRPAHAPAGEIEITDPDLHLVVIKQR